MIVDELNIYDMLDTDTKFELAKSVEGLKRARFFNPLLLGTVLYILRSKRGKSIEPSDFTPSNPIIKIMFDKMNIQQENFSIVLSEMFSYAVSIIQYRQQSVVSVEDEDDYDEEDEDEDD
jgi:hypothetical protein